MAKLLYFTQTMEYQNIYIYIYVYTHKSSFIKWRLSWRMWSCDACLSVAKNVLLWLYNLVNFQLWLIDINETRLFKLYSSLSWTINHSALAHFFLNEKISLLRLQLLRGVSHRVLLMIKSVCIKANAINAFPHVRKSEQNHEKKVCSLTNATRKSRAIGQKHDEGNDILTWKNIKPINFFG